MVEASSQLFHVADIRLRRPGAAWLGPSKVTDTVVMLCKVVTFCGRCLCGSSGNETKVTTLRRVVVTSTIRARCVVASPCPL